MISLRCIPKIDSLVEKFALNKTNLTEEAKAIGTPMSKDIVASQLPCAPKGEDTIAAGVPLAVGHKYYELTGSLMCIRNTTRPDIAQAAGVLSSRHRMVPTTSYGNEAIRVLKDLKDTRDGSDFRGKGP